MALVLLCDAGQVTPSLISPSIKWAMTLLATQGLNGTISARAPWGPFYKVVAPLVAFTGTAARFSGQSFGRYSLPEAQNWHIRFRLKTLQSQAILLFSNGTVYVSLKVRHWCHGNVPGWEVGAAWAWPRRPISAKKSLIIGSGHETFQSWWPKPPHLDICPNTTIEVRQF